MKKTFLILATLLLTVSLFAQKDTITNPYHFTINIGYGFMPQKDHDNLFANLASDETHSKKVRSGVSYEFDYDYNFHKNYACGVEFSMFNAFDSYMPTDSAKSSYSDDRYVFYVGPTFLYHTDLIKEHYTLFARATMGWMGFRNSMRNNKSVTYKRNCFGYGITAGVDYMINDYLSVVGGISYLGGTCGKMKDNDSTYTLDKKENLSRFNISLGVKVKL
jgi:opacity protein-like surface antigen